MTDASRRDAETDALLRRMSSLAPDPPPSPACLDAETAAAWLADELPSASREAALAHVADCARCQQLLATLTKLDTDEAAAAEPMAARRWWAYLVPIGAVALMLAVVVGLPRETQPSQPAAAPPKQAPTQALRDVESRFEAAPTARTDKKEAATAANARGTLDRDRNSASAKLGERTQPAASADLKTKDTREPTERNAAVAAAAPPAQMAAKPRSQSTADTLRTIDEQKNEKVQAYAVITTPDRNVQWRARGAVVEKSTDAARTWTATPIEPTAEWTAGSAPSTTVCWLVGRGGAVARTVDGRTWQRLTFPAPTDLSAVQASDAQTATITTADGRTFVTTDGGNTWIPRVLQEFPAAPFKE